MKAALAALVATGCLAVPDPAGTHYRCDRDPRCPAGFVCDGMTCVASPGAEPGMVAIPAGTFMMGCPTTATCRTGEQPEHAVTLAAFAIEQTEVSQVDYMACTACTLPPSFVPDADPKTPMRFVEWAQATAYCAFRGRRLPSEAEWERAARVMEHPFPWGDTPAPDCAHAIAAGCPGPVAVDTASQGDAPGPVHHLLGNVREWVDDAYDPAFYASAAAATNPHSAGPDDNDRVLRGGSFMTAPGDLAVWRRDHLDRKQHVADIGIRCAK